MSEITDSQERELIQRKCGNKRGYVTNKEARRAKKKYCLDHPGEKMEIYTCPYCALLHMGHRFGSPRRTNEDKPPMFRMLLQNPNIAV